MDLVVVPVVAARMVEMLEDHRHFGQLHVNGEHSVLVLRETTVCDVPRSGPA
jgi:hypothetical protein